MFVHIVTYKGYHDSAPATHQMEWSATICPPSTTFSARLNLTSWSTASLPTRASATNRTRSGALTQTGKEQSEVIYSHASWGLCISDISMCKNVVDSCTYIYVLLTQNNVWTNRIHKLMYMYVHVHTVGILICRYMATHTPCHQWCQLGEKYLSECHRRAAVEGAP